VRTHARADAFVASEKRASGSVTAPSLHRTSQDERLDLRFVSAGTVATGRPDMRTGRRGSTRKSSGGGASGRAVAPQPGDPLAGS